jgi:hypothetical protein
MGASAAVAEDVCMSNWLQTEAERAFGRANRSRRRAHLMRRLQRVCACCDRLAVAIPVSGRRAGRGVRSIPLEQITGTLEPNRAEQFDHEFRPSGVVRERWQRLWIAEARGAVLPPIDVVPDGEGYAVRDGHHRVSVAFARGAVSIDAVVSAA